MHACVICCTHMRVSVCVCLGAWFFDLKRPNALKYEPRPNPENRPETEVAEIEHLLIHTVSFKSPLAAAPLKAQSLRTPVGLC